MKKLLNFCLIMILTILFSFNIFPLYPKALSDVSIVEDAANTLTLPHLFRKSSNSVPKIDSNQNLNLYGLSTLNISGSAQFSENGLSLIKNSVGTTYPITVIDLRQESHGFVNGTAISFKNINNDANKGLTRTEVLAKESKDLSSIKIAEPLTFSNKNITVYPKVIQNELALTRNKGISYVRIPVTDGGLPSEDMVNYFVNFVKTQKNNTWLHFHCKAGIGRTTTFMIMYDIMKNCSTVPLNDIIIRQILLSKMNESDSKDFYSGNRFNFLSNFYTKCKNNNFSIQSSSISKVTNTTDSYIKNSIIPKLLYVISESDLTHDEQTMIATLQGIVSNKSESQIYILSNNEPDYEIWLKDLKDNYNVKCKYIKNPWKLLKIFKSYVNGYILYNNSNKYSINNACSLASLKDSIVINELLESKVKLNGINNLIHDCRNTDKYWAYNTLWNLGLNHSTVIQLPPNKSMALRDYGIMSKSLFFYEDDSNDISLKETIFKSMDSTSRVLGWGTDEHTNVTIASKFGVDVIAADWSYNLSVLSSYPTTPKKQNSNNITPKENGVHYVTFVMSDGDNQQWFLGNNFTSPKWYGSNNRGNFNLGWSISPSLYYLAPTVFEKYYESATYHDNFVTPPSGNGYMYPSKFPFDKLDYYTNRLNDYMGTVDQNYVLILDDEALDKSYFWDKYTSKSNIDGLLYLNYNKNSSYNGKIIWSNNKPVLSCRDLIWEGLEDENQLVKNITHRVESGYTNINDPNSYTFVYVHVWSKTMDSVQNLVNKIQSNPSVRIVTPSTFMNLIKENIKHT